jgi:hypothetical protein
MELEQVSHLLVPEKRCVHKNRRGKGKRRSKQTSVRLRCLKEGETDFNLPKEEPKLFLLS